MSEGHRLPAPTRTPALCGSICAMRFNSQFYSFVAPSVKEPRAHAQQLHCWHEDQAVDAVHGGAAANERQRVVQQAAAYHLLPSLIRPDRVCPDRVHDIEDKPARDRVSRSCQPEALARNSQGRERAAASKGMGRGAARRT